MEPLAALLLKYKSLTATDDVARKAIIKYVKEHCDIDIPEYAIKVSKGMITISIHPLEKRAIQQEKEHIVRALFHEGISTELI